MAPKSQKNTGSRSKAQDDEKEDPLQAVVIADTFETRFAPFTLERPRCLLPLANVPMIEYTLDFLARSGVQEVFLSAGPHTEQVERYIESSKWANTHRSPFKRLTFLKSAATSVGDVMRDLDQKSLVGGDFLVVSGDVVSNFPIADAMTKHKARRLRDKNAIMTMLLREKGRDQTTSERLPSSPVFVIDPTKDRCLHYEEPSLRGRSDLILDPEMLAHPEMEIRQDLIDCRIDICCPEMLSLWSDNFDNQSLRKDFLHGILKDYELNGKTVHTHVFNDYFARRASDLSTYNTLSREICARWTFPECPDADDRYTFTRGSFYQGNGVSIARSCRIGPGSMIGPGTKISEHSLVHKSVIGKHCRIGRNVEIRHAYIWDRAVIENDCKILHAIVADDVVVGQGSQIHNGSLISFGVRLDKGRNIGNGSRITRARINGDMPNAPHKELVGEGGDGYVYEEDQDEAETEPRPNGLVYQEPDFASSESSIASTGSEISIDLNRHGGDGRGGGGGGGSRSESFTTPISDEDDGGGSGDRDRFHHEAITSLLDRMKKTTHQDDVHVELMGLRFAQNASGAQVRRAVAVALMMYILHQIEEEKTPTTTTKTSAADAVKQAITTYRKLIRRDDNNNNNQETGSVHVDFLLEAQKDLIRRKGGGQILLHLVKELYDQDVFEEEIVIGWWNDDRSKSSDELRRTRQPTQRFIDWLANAEEEESDDDDDDD